MKDIKKLNSEMQATKKRLHLAEAARKQARNMEMDYESVSLCIKSISQWLVINLCYPGHSRHEKGNARVTSRFIRCM